MDQTVFDFFTKTGRPRSVRKGEVIIRAHDQPTGVFLIVDGHIKTYSITKYGETNLHLIRKRGDVFPIIWAMADVHREVFYEAMGPSELLKVTKREFHGFVSSDQEIQSLLVKQAVELYRIHADRVNNLQLRTAKERVAYRLLALAERFGVKKGRFIRIEAPLRHQDIADSINTARETTSRELEKLEKKDIISYKGHLLVIKKKKALQSNLS